MSDAPVRLHPGEVIHVWDHYVIGLRDGDLERQLSLYAITYSPELGSGTVCLLTGSDAPTRLYADEPDLGQAMAERLRRMGTPDERLTSEVTTASFRRSALPEGGFAWLVDYEAGRVEGRWEATSPAVWAQGPAPAFWAEEDIWACFVEAGRASIEVDGTPLSGDVFEQQEWAPKLGRTLSSAHVALAEVRVTPAATRRLPAASASALP